MSPELTERSRMLKEQLEGERSLRCEAQKHGFSACLPPLQSSSPVSLSVKNSSAWGIFFDKSRKWGLDPFPVLGLNLELSFRFKRLFVHPCCFSYLFYQSLVLEQGKQRLPFNFLPISNYVT
jgi:hypothetical protein